MLPALARQRRQVQVELAHLQELVDKKEVQVATSPVVASEFVEIVAPRRAANCRIAARDSSVEPLVYRRNLPRHHYCHQELGCL